MPSINRYVEINKGRRVRLNTCEGAVGITDERYSEAERRWHGTASINLDREQAERLIAQLADQMAKNF